jgi:hypothetical protein
VNLRKDHYQITTLFVVLLLFFPFLGEKERSRRKQREVGDVLVGFISPSSSPISFCVPWTLVKFPGVLFDGTFLAVPILRCGKKRVESTVGTKGGPRSLLSFA